MSGCSEFRAKGGRRERRRDARRRRQRRSPRGRGRSLGLSHPHGGPAVADRQGGASGSRRERTPPSASSGLSLSDLDPEATAPMVAGGTCACWPTNGLLARGPPSTRARERFARVRSTALRGHVEATGSVETKDASRLSGQTSGVRPGSPRGLSRAAPVRHSLGAAEMTDGWLVGTVCWVGAATGPSSR